MSQIRILIVEDELIVSKDLEQRLKRLGYDVVGTAATGLKAIELANEKLPDIILMDIMLKGDMNGIEAADIIGKTLNIPYIYLTAYAENNTLEKAKLTEPYGYIVKPFKEIDIVTTLEMAVHKHQKNKEILDERNLLYQLVDNRDTNDFVFVKSKSKFIKIRTDDIIFIEALKDYVIIHTIEEKFTIHSTMKDIERKFDFDNYLRVHRSYIVNTIKISTIEHNTIIMENHRKEIPIGGSYKQNFINKMKWV
jgi:DNA-binding LytR/AlgR family response regulator